MGVALAVFTMGVVNPIIKPVFTSLYGCNKEEHQWPRSLLMVYKLFSVFFTVKSILATGFTVGKTPHITI